MRLVVITGMETSPLNLPVTSAKAARGTEVTMVGTRASCQPIPVLIRVAPGGFDGLAQHHHLVPGLPLSTRSAMDSR